MLCLATILQYRCLFSFTRHVKMASIPNLQSSSYTGLQHVQQRARKLSTHGQQHTTTTTTTNNTHGHWKIILRIQRKNNSIGLCFAKNIFEKSYQNLKGVASTRDGLATGSAPLTPFLLKRKVNELQYQFHLYTISSRKTRI